MVDRTTSIVRLEKAVELLAQARTLEDVRAVLDISAAAAAFAKSAKLGLEAQNMAAEISVLAQHKAGELLAQLKRAPAGRPRNTGNVAAISSAYKTALTESRASEREARRWQEVAQIPAPKLTAYIAQTTKSGHELSTAGLLRDIGRGVRRDMREQKLADIARSNQPLDGSIGRFPLLYADPPWRYEHVESESRAIENQYPTMQLSEICALPVANVTTDDAILYLWSTSPLQAHAHRVIEAWGFDYRTNMVWDKERIGMGYYVRRQHEQLMIAIKGNPPTPAFVPHSIVRQRRSNVHSAKPDSFYELIERMYPELPKLELFSRSPRQGWSAWGNQSAA